MSQEPVAVPAWVAELAGGAPVTPVWRNGLGGLTFRFGRGEEYLKVQRPGLDWDPDADVARLNWLKGIVPVPRVLASGEHEDQRWLLTAGLPGRTAVHRIWRERPEVVIPALGRALRRFHDSVPVSGCPFSWSVGYRVRRHGLAPAYLDRTPPVDAVVCHGDACNPNFLFADDGTLTGYVDLWTGRRGRLLGRSGSGIAEPDLELRTGSRGEVPGRLRHRRRPGQTPLLYRVVGGRELNQVAPRIVELDGRAGVPQLGAGRPQPSRRPGHVRIGR